MNVFHVLMIFTVASGALMCSTARAAAYHVSPGGDDANPGTQAQPWRTIDRVNKADLDPGDRVLFEGGKTFPGTITLDARDSGVPDRSVVISSYGEGRAVIDGGEGTGLLAEGCDFLVVEEINFVGCGRKNGNSGAGVQINNSQRLEITNVDARGFRNGGVLADGVRNARITKVYAHDNGATGIGVGGDEEHWSEDVYIGRCIAENNAGDPKNLDNHSGNGIVVGTVRGCVIEYCEAMNNGWNMPRDGNGPVGIWAWNADRVVIQFCISHDNKSPSWDGGGFDLDGGVTNSIMQYNLSYNNVGPGYLLCQYYPAPTWKDNIIRYNISYNDGDKPENGSFGVGWYELMSDADIYNNTFIKEYGPVVSFNQTKAPGMRFRNNIFVSGSQLITGGAEKGDFQGNVYWLLGGKPFEIDGFKSLEEWSAVTGQERVDGKLAGRWCDPQLVMPPDRFKFTKPEDLKALKEFRLKAKSPCAGAGVPIEGNGGRDFWGMPVSKEKRPSAGACEAP